MDDNQSITENNNNNQQTQNAPTINQYLPTAPPSPTAYRSNSQAARSKIERKRLRKNAEKNKRRQQQQEEEYDDGGDIDIDDDEFAEFNDMIDDDEDDGQYQQQQQPQRKRKSYSQSDLPSRKRYGSDDINSEGGFKRKRERDREYQQSSKFSKKTHYSPSYNGDDEEEERLSITSSQYNNNRQNNNNNGGSHQISSEESRNLSTKIFNEVAGIQKIVTTQMLTEIQAFRYQCTRNNDLSNPLLLNIKDITAGSSYGAIVNGYTSIIDNKSKTQDVDSSYAFLINGAEFLSKGGNLPFFGKFLRYLKPLPAFITGQETTLRGLIRDVNATDGPIFSFTPKIALYFAIGMAILYTIQSAHREITQKEQDSKKSEMDQMTTAQQSQLEHLASVAENQRNQILEFEAEVRRNSEHIQKLNQERQRLAVLQATNPVSLLDPNYQPRSKDMRMAQDEMDGKAHHNNNNEDDSHNQDAVPVQRMTTNDLKKNFKNTIKAGDVPDLMTLLHSNGAMAKDTSSNNNKRQRVVNDDDDDLSNNNNKNQRQNDFNANNALADGGGSGGGSNNLSASHFLPSTTSRIADARTIEQMMQNAYANVTQNNDDQDDASSITGVPLLG